TLTSPLTSCAPSLFGSTHISIPAPGTENDDRNPPRIAARNLFDAAIGHDNLFHGDRYKWAARFTVINLTNEEALYNFLSTFSGTHFVTPRSYNAALTFNFSLIWAGFCRSDHARCRRSRAITAITRVEGPDNASDDDAASGN